MKRPRCAMHVVAGELVRRVAHEQDGPAQVEREARCGTTSKDTTRIGRPDLSRQVRATIVPAAYDAERSEERQAPRSGRKERRAEPARTTGRRPTPRTTSRPGEQKEPGHRDERRGVITRNSPCAGCEPESAPTISADAPRTAASAHRALARIRPTAARGGRGGTDRDAAARAAPAPGECTAGAWRPTQVKKSTMRERGTGRRTR